MTEIVNKHSIYLNFIYEQAIHTGSLIYYAKAENKLILKVCEDYYIGDTTIDID